MRTLIKLASVAACLAAAVTALPAAAQVRVGVQVGAPVYVQPQAYYAAPVVPYGPPRVVQQGYFDSRYDHRERGRYEGDWRRRQWLRHEEMRREEWRRQQWRREHWRQERAWGER